MRARPSGGTGVFRLGCYSLQFRILLRHSKQMAADRQELGAIARAEKSEVADANKAFGQHMKEEPPQELIDR